jgi:anthranilate phosphoribosyltransferase
VWELEAGKVSSYRIKPEDFGIAVSSLENIKAGNAEESAKVIRGVLAGDPGPSRDIVVMNAGATLFVAGISDTLNECMSISENSIDSGKAMKSLNEHVKFSNAM